MWSFGTSPSGLALTARQLWGLSPREYRALRRQFEQSKHFQLSMVAAIRADLHNIWLHAGKTDKNHPAVYVPADFFNSGARPSNGSNDSNGSAPVSHGQPVNQEAFDLEERIRSGGRVASQSVENQMAIFASMLEAAKAPPSQIVYENITDGRVLTEAEWKALNNGN